MYYDLIASLPHLPHFAEADRSPITPLRLEQRLRRLRPTHADQLRRAQAIVRWRPTHFVGPSDAAIVKAYLALMDSELETPLREYVAFRLDQQMLLAALRRKRNGVELPEATNSWGAGPRAFFIRQHWDVPDFGLAHLYPWLPLARERLTAGDARGLERVLMDVAWRRLSQFAERNMFGFEAVFAYVFQWEILQAWLVCNEERARTKFADWTERVTHAEQN